MDNYIVLEFDRTLYGLAGYDFGSESYQKQVEGKIDYSKPIIFRFPENIQLIASSFIQGFFAVLKERIGLEGIEEQVTIIASDDSMKEMVIENLL